ncbi:AbrB/MazE/SpoVT family DNA-binding domain-containing protein [Metabacillus herbersteinensis]|uniref:AbrB/MazE/SpoVT family DNA-binding domain-containing protein n=1 Tax=Metabacillus herbersteinensis TaxID=283816 RepID=A0ABV6GKW8_9BACI
MKSTGIVRKTDPLGRIVIPIELRKVLNINIKDPLEIFVVEEQIVLKKYEPQNVCVITGKVASSNFNVANGNITLSSEGADQLSRELELFLCIKA